MSIDRKKFLMLALSMSMGACVASNPPPAVTPVGDKNDHRTAPADEAMAPSEECVNYDPSGECIEWMPAGEGYGAPADECVDWDPSGECTGWAPAGEGYGAPADECVDWDPSGECIQWQ